MWNAETFALLWNVICFALGGFIVWCAMTTSELRVSVVSEEQTFEIINRIVERGSAGLTITEINKLQDELQQFLLDEELVYVSKDLQEIISEVLNKEVSFGGAQDDKK
jgi:hypothetical protein